MGRADGDGGAPILAEFTQHGRGEGGSFFVLKRTTNV